MVAVSHDGKRTATLSDVPGASGLQLHDSREVVRGGFLVAHDTGDIGVYFKNGKSQFRAWVQANGAANVTLGDEVNGIAMHANQEGASMDMMQRQTIGVRMAATLDATNGLVVNDDNGQGVLVAVSHGGKGILILKNAHGEELALEAPD